MKTEKHETIFSLLMQAEETEKKAIARRIELENEIYEYLQQEKLLKKNDSEEGQESIEELGYKITVNRPIAYKIDEEKYRLLCKTLPNELQFHVVKINLDKKKYNSVLSIADKKYIKKIQDVITVTPGKISIKVKKI